MVARNIEIKACLKQPVEFKKTAETICDFQQKLNQIDTFFNFPRGRLKLREESNGNAEIIYYCRNNHVDPKVSHYLRYPIQNSKHILEIFNGRFGIRGIVKKMRSVYYASQVRIHYDEVEELGQFMESEVILMSNQSICDGLKISRRLMDQFKICRSDYVSESYIDLIERGINTNLGEVIEKGDFVIKNQTSNYIEKLINST